MKKGILTAAIASLVVMATATTSFAGEWHQIPSSGKWYYTTDLVTGGFIRAYGWKWIDGNGDGVAERYYFDDSGYLVTNSTTPDGSTVNGDGAWVVDGVVQAMPAAEVVEKIEGELVGRDVPTFDMSSGTLADETYNEYGINRTAIKMIDQSREENAVYGEVSAVEVDYESRVAYANGFQVTYPKNHTGYTIITIDPNRQDINGTLLLKYYYDSYYYSNRVKDTAEKDAYARSIGLPVVSNTSSIHDSIWLECLYGDRAINVTWYCSNRIMIYITDHPYFQ